jgi:uncharacterized membrane protein
VLVFFSPGAEYVERGSNDDGVKRADVEPLDFSRLVSFSDGVFAVAITLLVLDIQVPEGPIGLRQLLSAQFPHYLIFVVSFIMVGIKWLNHHRMFTLIARANTTLSILNLVLLLSICTVPFTAAIVAKYMTTPDAGLAAVVYGIVWVAVGCLYTIIYVYTEKAGLAKPRPASRVTTILYFIGPIGYLAAIALSFVNIYAGIALNLIIVALYIPPQRAKT